MTPKVSICIPVYNVQEYIEECLESVIHQTYSNVEIIIVNDCTPDNSMEIVNRYVSSDSRIRILEHCKNKGLMRARQTGYMAATGDYIAFCDSDDTLPSNCIEKLLNTAVKTDADIVSGNMQRFINNQFYAPDNYSLPYGTDPESVYKALLCKKYSHTLWGKLFKTRLLKNYKYTTLDNATNAEDGILFYQIIQHSDKTISISDVVYYYRYNPTSSTNSRFKYSSLSSIFFLQTLRQNIGEKYPALYENAWIYIANVINNLYANGYDKEYDLKKIIKEYHFNKYLDYKQMLHHIPIKLFIKLVLLRIFKPYYILYLIRQRIK